MTDAPLDQTVLFSALLKAVAVIEGEEYMSDTAIDLPPRCTCTSALESRLKCPIHRYKDTMKTPDTPEIIATEAICAVKPGIICPKLGSPEWIRFVVENVAKAIQAERDMAPKSCPHNHEAKDDEITSLRKRLDEYDKASISSNIEYPCKSHESFHQGCIRCIYAKAVEADGLRKRVEELKKALREIMLMWQSIHDYTCTQSIWDMVHTALNTDGEKEHGAKD